MTVKLVLLIIASIVLVLTSAWYYKTRELEPLIGIFTAISGILVLALTGSTKGRKRHSITQEQKSGNNSKNYQAGGDINIH